VTLLATWSVQTSTCSLTTVVPDGCRDLIIKTVEGAPPHWFVSPLFDHAKSILVEEHSVLMGFRFKAGVEIAEAELIDFIKQKPPYPDDVKHYLDDFTRLDCAVEEALDCLASDVLSIKEASLRLGVSSRTLQRLVLAKTGRTPSYWFQLARARKAARCISGSVGFSEAAEQYGFSDQAHMNREFRRWFRATPSEILKSPTIIEQLHDTGYG